MMSYQHEREEFIAAIVGEGLSGEQSAVAMETMECRDCGFKGDDVQDFITTEVPGERYCPKCSGAECFMTIKK